MNFVSKNLDRINSDPIIAEITGSDTAKAEGFNVRSYSPVLALCRKLIAEGFDPGRPLHAFCADVLCFSVRSIGEGAALCVKDTAQGRPRFRTYSKTDGPGKEVFDLPDLPEMPRQPVGRGYVESERTGLRHTYTDTLNPVEPRQLPAQGYTGGCLGMPASWPVKGKTTRAPDGTEPIFVKATDGDFSVVGANTGAIISDGLPSEIEAKRFVDGFDDARQRFGRRRKRGKS